MAVPRRLRLPEHRLTTALLTGATGFVGANLARRLLHDGHAVHCLVRDGHDPWRLEELGAAVTRHTVDLTDTAAVTTLVARVQPEWVFHLAVHGAYSWQRDADAIVRTNVLGTLALATACRAAEVPVLVNTGSSSEYGTKDHAPDERDVLDPNSDYAWTKAAATHLVRHWALREGRRWSTLRLYTAFGPWEEPNRLVPTLIVRGLDGSLPPLTQPDTARDWVHVDDVCDAFVLAAMTGTPGAVWNVGSGTQTTLREVVEVTRRTLGLTVEPQWGAMADRTWDTSVWVSDPRAIRAALGWEARTTFADGFARTVEWLRARPAVLAAYRARLR
ncbi:MAG TPA: NAD-dependent epimerase/dehydratase family protein [Candidatus Binatia bacterium]|nr:NAD-dependent epimerase/dehydratase family protein [Candidatus Binatia bacterium]